jgi:hypothetical protein
MIMKNEVERIRNADDNEKRTGKDSKRRWYRKKNWKGFETQMIKKNELERIWNADDNEKQIRKDLKRR